MRILNLFAGLGGNRELWDCFKARITAVEINPILAEIYQERFPNDEIIISDAYSFVEENVDNYDIIWSSPPCASHTAMRNFANVKKILPDTRLYSLIIFLTNFYKGNWIVENVRGYYKPLVKPQSLDRHYLWSNKRLIPYGKKSITYNFWQMNFEQLATILKFDLKIKERLSLINPKHPEQLLRNCVDPELGKHLLKQLLTKKKTIKKYLVS